VISLLTSFLLILWPGPGAQDLSARLAVPDPGKIRVRTVVIDAGHGGKDPGCSGAGSLEKEITLSMALKLRQLIQTRHPDVKVVLTRDKDIFIPLHERSQIANKAQADLFISLHCNAMPQPSRIHGSETYVLGLHRAEANLAVARRENESVLLEDNYKLNYGDFDPSSTEAEILIGMYQSAYLDNSILFARLVEEEIRDHAGRHSKGVKQAGFLVLWNNAMPSVLVEAGFLTHAEEERFLSSAGGQDKIAESLVRAFGRYKRKVEEGVLPASADSLAPAPAKTPDPTVKPRPTTTTAWPSGLWYGLQVGALGKPMPADHPLRTRVSPLLEKQEGLTYKYICGPFSSREEADRKRKELLQSGIVDIFVVTYRGEVRVQQP
jgi:N-acetylmuramoyl-L-alanine amidase